MNIPEQISLQKPIVPPTPPTEPIPQPEPPPNPETTSNPETTQTISVDDFLGTTHTSAKYSADSVITPQEDGSVTIETPAPPIIAGRQPLTEAEALKETRILMDMRETVQAMLLAAIADGNVTGIRIISTARPKKLSLSMPMRL